MFPAMSMDFPLVKKRFLSVSQPEPHTELFLNVVEENIYFIYFFISLMTVSAGKTEKKDFRLSNFL